MWNGIEYNSCRIKPIGLSYFPHSQDNADTANRCPYRYECSKNIQVFAALEDTENVKGSEKLVFNALIFGAFTMRHC